MTNSLSGSAPVVVFLVEEMERTEPFLSFFFFKVIHVCERVSGGGAERERGRERIPSRLRTVNAEPDTGLDPTNQGIMT